MSPKINPETLSLPTQQAILQACQQSNLGKLLPAAFYIHESALRLLDENLQHCATIGRHYLNRSQRRGASETPITLIKFHLDQPAISFLHYPDFFADPHPALQSSTKVQLLTGELGYRNYSQTPNPPVLHRKETFLSPSHPRYSLFAELTRQQDILGLLKDSRTIGTRNGWRKRLNSHHIEIINHCLACPIAVTRVNSDATTTHLISSENRAQRASAQRHANFPKVTNPQIDRHRAAIHRSSLSKPVRLALWLSPLCLGHSFSKNVLDRLT